MYNFQSIQSSFKEMNIHIGQYFLFTHIHTISSVLHSFAQILISIWYLFFFSFWRTFLAVVNTFLGFYFPKCLYYALTFLKKNIIGNECGINSYVFLYTYSVWVSLYLWIYSFPNVWKVFNHHFFRNFFCLPSSLSLLLLRL